LKSKLDEAWNTCIISLCTDELHIWWGNI
jgi:hypothetical protein